MALFLGCWLLPNPGDKRGLKDARVAFSFSVVADPVMSYYANSYDLTLLLLPLLLIGESVLERGRTPVGLRPSSWGTRLLLLCTPLLWVLAFKVDQFCWIALLLLALALSIFALGKVGHSPARRESLRPTNG